MSEISAQSESGVLGSDSVVSWNVTRGGEALNPSIDLSLIVMAVNASDVEWEIRRMLMRFDTSGLGAVASVDLSMIYKQTPGYTFNNRNVQYDIIADYGVITEDDWDQTSLHDLGTLDWAGAISGTVKTLSIDPAFLDPAVTAIWARSVCDSTNVEPEFDATHGAGIYGLNVPESAPKLVITLATGAKIIRGGIIGPYMIG